MPCVAEVCACEKHGLPRIVLFPMKVGHLRPWGPSEKRPAVLASMGRKTTAQVRRRGDLLTFMAPSSPRPSRLRATLPGSGTTPNWKTLVVPETSLVTAR